MSSNRYYTTTYHPGSINTELFHPEIRHESYPTIPSGRSVSDPLPLPTNQGRNFDPDNFNVNVQQSLRNSPCESERVSLPPVPAHIRERSQLVMPQVMFDYPPDGYEAGGLGTGDAPWDADLLMPARRTGLGNREGSGIASSNGSSDMTAHTARSNLQSNSPETESQGFFEANHPSTSHSSQENVHLNETTESQHSEIQYQVPIYRPRDYLDSIGFPEENRQPFRPTPQGEDWMDYIGIVRVPEFEGVFEGVFEELGNGNDVEGPARPSGPSMDKLNDELRIPVTIPELPNLPPIPFQPSCFLRPLSPVPSPSYPLPEPLSRLLDVLPPAVQPQPLTQQTTLNPLTSHLTVRPPSQTPYLVYFTHTYNPHSSICTSIISLPSHPSLATLKTKISALLQNNRFRLAEKLEGILYTRAWKFEVAVRWNVLIGGGGSLERMDTFLGCDEDLWDVLGMMTLRRGYVVGDCFVVDCVARFGGVSGGEWEGSEDGGSDVEEVGEDEDEEEVNREVNERSEGDVEDSFGGL